MRRSANLSNAEMERRAKIVRANRAADAAAERQRREDERIRQILSATGHNYLSDEVRGKLLAILSDVAVNGI